jgi:hypothetical protein
MILSLKLWQYGTYTVTKNRIRACALNISRTGMWAAGGALFVLEILLYIETVTVMLLPLLYDFCSRAGDVRL